MPLPSGIDDLLTVAQVARKYHLQNSTIRTYIKKGLLPAQKTPGGKNWLIREQDAIVRLSAQPPTEVRSVPAPSDPGSSHRVPNPHSPLIDRLGTPEGRARLVAFLRELREDDDEGEQEAAWSVLKNGVTPLSLRQWSPDGDEASEANP